MDIDLARQMVRADFRASRELGTLLRTLKANCSEGEYRDLALGVAAAIDGINTALTRKAIASHPELEAEIDASIREYGRYRA
jgi:hypothetical protein